MLAGLRCDGAGTPLEVCLLRVRGSRLCMTKGGLRSGLDTVLFELPVKDAAANGVNRVALCAGRPALLHC